MIECPNCGSELKYDIIMGEMNCSHCDSFFDPYEVSKAGAEERTEYEVTIFTCPQCGGEIVSQDTTAAAFCSFCGASTILTSRIEKEKKPDFIIPFQKTKEECKEAYKKVMKHAIYAPKELKNIRNIESFRGIYMPYWVYYLEQDGELLMKGSESHREGDYIITTHYNINMELDSYYKGIAYDASSSFSDDISSKIAPYNVKNMKEFSPAFLSGFYADIADVEDSVYQSDAGKLAARQTAKCIRQRPELVGISVEDPSDRIAGAHTRIKAVDSAMFPVWFMAYRNRDRVAYATVNGQTGKVMVDLPVDMKKYFLGTAVIAVILMILLNLFATFIPHVLVSILSVFAAIVSIVYCAEFNAMAKKESYQDDKGALAGLENVTKKKRKQWRKEFGDDLEPVEIGSSIIEQKKRAGQDAQLRDFGKKHAQNIVPIIMFVTMIVIVLMGRFSSGIGVFSPSVVISGIVVILAGILFGVDMSRAKKITVKKSMPASFFVFLAVVITFVIAMLNPVNDLYYYAAAIGITIGSMVALIDLILNYNILATRKLPQFDYHGGDDRA